MTQENLKQYRFLKKEIKVIEDRINELENETVLDAVSGSTSYMPYVKRTMVIEGVDIARINSLKRLLVNRKHKAYTILKEIETFINTIDDSTIRQIIQLRYIDGRSWSSIANKIYGYPCGNRARMKVERFLKKF